MQMNRWDDTLRVAWLAMERERRFYTSRANQRTSPRPWRVRASYAQNEGKEILFEAQSATHGRFAGWCIGMELPCERMGGHLRGPGFCNPVIRKCIADKIAVDNLARTCDRAHWQSCQGAISMPNAQELHIGDKVREGDDMHCGRVVAIDLQRNALLMGDIGNFQADVSLLQL